MLSAYLSAIDIKHKSDQSPYKLSAFDDTYLKLSSGINTSAAILSHIFSSSSLRSSKSIKHNDEDLLTKCATSWNNEKTLALSKSLLLIAMIGNVS